MLLADQVAIVTGGSRGIGRAVVLALAKEGAKVAFVYRGSSDAAAALEAEVAAAGGLSKAVQGDVADPATATRVVDGAVADWGRVDILVNNAGVVRDGLFVRMDAAAWGQVIDTNLTGAFHFCRAAAEVMVFKQRSGRIVNISSVAADRHNPGQANYAASKGGLNSLTRALAVEFGARNVTVNAVAPGFIETDMSAAVRQKAGDAIAKAVPLRRLGRPEDIAGVVLFLCSAAAGYVTGQVLTVDGGLGLGAGVA